VTKEKIRKKLRNLGDIPGVYLMKDSKGEVIYVGKASSLKKRVSSYFQAGCSSVKTLVLVEKTEDFDFIPVVSEAEALILENRLIKKYQPRYNVSLKDGKSYPFVKLTGDKFPSIRIVREAGDDRSVYYGPFTDARLLKDLVKFIRRYYPVRDCRRIIGEKSLRACTQYYMGRCAGPCAGKISRDDYGVLVSGIKAFFGGRYGSFEKRLRRWLQAAVKRLDFEEALKIKERLLMLEAMKKKFPLREEKELLSYGETNVLNNLASLLRLEKSPYAIEGFDVSNIAGTFATASKVLFKGGVPDRAGYRKYRIFFKGRVDDYRMIEEALSRRFSSDGDRVFPDLVLIDGGKGHLGVAAEVLKREDIAIPVIALSKEHEEVHALFTRNPIKLPASSPELHLLQRVRDEAHRFALSYHRKLRAKSIRESFFDSIEGVGEKRKRKLMQAFQDIPLLAETDSKKLKDMGLPEKVAVEVIRRAKNFEGG